jgi:acyl transferase domain-containing protein/acyl carrier protein
LSERLEFRHDGSEIAVVGMSGRFPGAPDIDAFWRNLASGVESITRFSADELRRAGEDEERLADPDYVPARPVLDGVERFDAAFFGFSPREAEVLDPQLRLFLECAFSALEHAGYDPERLPGRASVFAGASFSNYLVHNLYKNRPVMEAFGDMQATMLNVQDSLVTMTGYKLNLKGACCAVQTFCSTSLVGVHLACQNLLGYESDLALAGGVTVYVPQESGYLYEEGSIVSRDGHCRAFDARADGTVFGNGLGVVVLRRLKDALEEGDTVHAVIRGSAVNNDGSLKVSYAAPGVVGQTEVVVEALSAAGVDPATIGYVEAHGTATRLGDPAEVSALTRAFRTRTDRKGFCALGSVKTNVGHLDAAAGVAGLIKVVLSLRHGRIPPSLHFETPNPAIDFAASPFYVNPALREWPRLGAPRRAGVSAFGVGGTNAHVIVEEAPESRSEASARGPQILLLSAKTPSALDAATLRLAAHLEADAGLSLADAAWTLQVGRGAFAHRRFVVASSLADAASALRSASSGGSADPPSVVERKNPPILLWLSGEEAGRAGAWRALYEAEPAFREDFQRSVRATAHLGKSMEEALYPIAGTQLPAGGASLEAGLQPLASFALQHALVQLLKSLGLRFEAIVGDGVGAVAAECLEQTIAFERAARLAARRGRPDAFPSEPPLETRASEEAARALPHDTGRLRLRVGAGSIGLESRADAPEPACAPGRAELLTCLGRLWLRGVDVDWRVLHASERRKRVPLPTYPFDGERFWVEPVLEPVKAPERNPAEWMYRPVWKLALPARTDAPPPGGSWLVFDDDQGLGALLVDRLRAHGAEVLTVVPGRRFAREGEDAYTLNPGEASHYRSLWEDLRARRRRPDSVLHLWSVASFVSVLGGRDRFEKATDLGFYSLLHLAATRPEGPLALHVVTTGLHEVIGGEPLAPEKAPLVALCRVLGQEDDQVHCASIDVELRGDGMDALVDGLVAELSLAAPEPVVALRRGRRWVQDFERLPLSAHQGIAPRLRVNGVYLITGGLGGVGYALGAALARGARAKLVLTGRRGLPPRDGWSEWTDTHDAADETAVRIRKVQALEALGAEVLVLKADAASAVEMRAVVEAARERFGALHGVIHAAGELSADTFRVARDLGREACERQFAPKVHGLFALAEALRDETPDVVLLTSSLSSVLGGVGYAAYAGANAFMDAFAALQNREGRHVWVSVDWDQWDLGDQAGTGTARLAVRGGTALRVDEGLAVFSAIVRLRGLERVVVSTGPLLARLERWVQPSSAPDVSRAGGSARPRPALGSSYVAPGSGTERALAVIWQELLGIEGIGRLDDFFELGGHSLFAARVLSRVRGAFGVSLPLEAVFDAPTVAGLAERVEAARGTQESREPPMGDRVEIEI